MSKNPRRATALGAEAKADTATADGSGHSSVKPSVPQPHGGALVPGAGGGPQPGSGRPPNELRASMRVILDKGLPYLEEFVVGEHGTPSDQLKAIDIAARVGLNVKVDKALIDELWLAVETTVAADQLPKVKHAWNRIVGRRLIEAVT